MQGTVQLGRGFFTLIAWLVPIGGLGVAALCVHKVVIPVLRVLAGRGPDERLGERPNIPVLLGVVVAFVAPFVVGTLWCALQVVAVRVAGDGTWDLRGPYGFTVGSVPASTPRTFEFQGWVRHWNWVYDGVPLTADDLRSEYWVVTADGTELSFTSLENQQAVREGSQVLARLGYAPGRGCAVSRGPHGGLFFEQHTAGPRGPLCAGPAHLAPAALRAGLQVLARWEADGWWYPGEITSVDGAATQVRFGDGSTSSFASTELRPGGEPPSQALAVEASAAGNSTYYACTLGPRRGDQWDLTWGDGTQERVALSRLRFRLP